jgi:hypothetical protein
MQLEHGWPATINEGEGCASGRAAGKNILRNTQPPPGRKVKGVFFGSEGIFCIFSVFTKEKCRAGANISNKLFVSKFAR